MVMMRLLTAGVFDVFPKLKIILGHYAEGLPFMIDRVDRPYLQGHIAHRPRRGAHTQADAQRLPAGQHARFDQRQLLRAAVVCTKSALGAERMVIGTDHPFENMSACMDFLEKQPMTDVERDHLYGRRRPRSGWERSEAATPTRTRGSGGIPLQMSHRPLCAAAREPA